ncbi:MAG: cytochrome c/FTR1 family iron permease [Gammaproteobacteria bacterium]|nr:cytochrome c/FTR1 family iron permease [Gammaproteobacteria bacterium]
MTQSALHILDYVGVDYPAAVTEGRVVDQAEFGEQVEFAAQLVILIQQLPATPDKETLVAEAAELRKVIASLAPAEDIQERCRRITAALISAYAVNVAPTRPPSSRRGETLYKEQCAGCHGAQGHGDGPLGAQFNPKPIDFHDRERQKQRSVYGLFSTITLGVDGTGMAGYGRLPDADRWALSFYISSWFATEAERERGASLAADDTAKAPVVDLAQLTQVTPEQIRTTHGSDGLAWLAWLRSHPEAVAAMEVDPIQIAREYLAAGLEAYRAGDAGRAYNLAVAGYLEGFELVEPALRPTAPELVTKIERAMLDYRATIKRGDPVTAIEGGYDHLQTLLAQAQERLGAGMLSPGMGFVSSFVILVREGLEAILVLAAVAAFLIKIGRRDALRYLHSGWIGALALGALTWIAAKFLIQVSGAGRELTEGITALFATAMLLWVGCWLHDYAHSEQWRQYISRHVQASLTRGTLWTLAIISFIAVYREIVETILFYEALWLQAGTEAAHSAIAAGMLVAAIALVGLGWAILRAGNRLPLRLFFTANTVILFVLAVIFAGKGVAALQEAGKLDISTIAIPTIDVLGIYPTAESAGLQVLIVILAAGFLAWRRWQRADVGEDL